MIFVDYSLDIIMLKQGLEAALLIWVFYHVYCYLTVRARQRAIIRENGCLPVKRYPSKDPLFGIDLFLENRRRFELHGILEYHKERFERMDARTITYPNLGRQVIFTMEPENLKTIQALDHKKWGLPQRRLKAFRPFLGVGIFTSNGDDWQHSRDLLRPNFHRSQITNLSDLEVHVRHLVDRIPRDGSTVDLQILFFRLTIDSATQLLFGESTLCLAPDANTASDTQLAQAFNRVQRGIAMHSRYGRLAVFLNKAAFNEDVKFVHEFVDRYVQKGLARRPLLLSEKRKESDRYLFIDELVRQTSDPVRIRSELLNILIAGRDTTASLLSNTWWIISRRPDVWSNLRREVDSLNGQKPSWEKTKELKYLSAVLKETLRLYPIVPANSREALVDTTLPVGGGPDGNAPIFIRKGQTVNWSLYAMHRRSDFYGDDADEFKPERWLGLDGLRPGWEYLPFNGGARVCVGQQFALTEASYTTVRLMQEFERIESRDGEPWREGLSLTCVGAGGCKVSLEPFSRV